MGLRCARHDRLYRDDRVQPAVIEDWEIWACANKLIELHGDDAPIHAAMRADALFEQGDQEGARVFRLIVHRVNEMKRGPTSIQ